MLERNKYKKQAAEQIEKYYKIRLENIIKVNEDSKEQVEREVHDTYYSYLLFDYVLNVRKTLKQKRILKTIFFFVVMAIFVLTFCCFLYSVQNVVDIINVINQNSSSNNKKIAIEMMTIIIPPLFSLIVAFIKIPEIIARYLFNIKEDEYMTSIIKNLQDYDKSIYSIEQKINENLRNIPMNNDNEMLDYPDEPNEEAR